MNAPARAAEVLRPAPLKWLAMVAIAAAFVWIGLGLRDAKPLTAWACIAIFGLCGAIGVLNLLPGASRLLLDDDGFETVSLFRRARVRWADVARFGTYRVGANVMVGFDLVDGYRGGDRLRQVNRSLCGFQGALPDTYGLKAGELAERMNARLVAWRASAGRD